MIGFLFVTSSKNKHRAGPKQEVSERAEFEERINLTRLRPKVKGIKTHVDSTNLVSPVFSWDGSNTLP